MIQLQYRDRYTDHYLDHKYPDERYEDALAYYEEVLKREWEETRILLTNDDDLHDWVIVVDNSNWWQE